jgi:hypothetical protein
MTLDQLQRDLSFTFPSSYRLMLSAGLLDHDSDECLDLSDTQWLTAPAISRSLIGPPSSPQFIPFAQSARADYWAWYRPTTTAAPSTIAFIPRDKYPPTAYAPSFEAAIYRLLLEEFSSSWLADRVDDPSTNLPPLFQRYAQAVHPHLPQTWATTLLELTRRPLFEAEPEIFAVLTRDEANSILHRDLNFPQLDQPL